MVNSKILIAGLVGGIVSFLCGFLIFGIALDGFAEANGGAIDASKADADYKMWSIFLGAMASGFMMAMIFGRWASISTVKTGAIAGSIIGVLIGINFNFIMYGTTELMTMPLVIVNSIAYAALYALIGAAVAYMLGRNVPAMAEATA